MLSREEEMKLNAMQRSWHHSRRSSSTFGLFDTGEEESVAEKPLNLPVQLTNRNEKFSAAPSTFPASNIEIDQKSAVKNNLPSIITLDASLLGDIPARYVIRALEPHQFPVVGVYVDRRVIPGFKYRVIPLPPLENPDHDYKEKHLFGAKALTLQSIGRGYARRFTFSGERCVSGNYFWSDNRPEGYAFEIEVVSVGDKFTIYNANHEAQGVLEIIDLDNRQVEISMARVTDGVEKRVEVKMTANVEFYDSPPLHIPISGVAVALKRKGEPTATILKVVNINIKNYRFYLMPGHERNVRRIKINGEEINDIPTSYTITGLERHEIPVIGTYVDPRITPGFTYRVRPTHSKQYLFNGKSLRLISIGIGYAKRFTFESDSKLNNDNYFWSDSHADGLAFETRAIHDNIRFNIVCNGQIVGESKVFRSELPQIEEYTEKVVNKSGKTPASIVKYVHVDVMCHVKLEMKNSGLDYENFMRVYGLAVLEKRVNARQAELLKIDNIAFDSQLNLSFARNKAKIIFIPLD